MASEASSGSYLSPARQLELLYEMIETQQKVINYYTTSGKPLPPDLSMPLETVRAQLESLEMFQSLHGDHHDTLGGRRGGEPRKEEDPSVVPLLTASIDPLKVDMNVYLPPNLRGQLTTGVAGLQNMGNTCFINSTLQCLMAADVFRNRVLALLFEAGSKEPLARLCQKYATLFWAGPRSPTTPLPTSAWVSVLPSWLGGYRQQDAQEFLIWLLDSLREEAKLVVKALPEAASTEDRLRKGASKVVSKTGNHSLRATRLFADTWIDEIFGSLFVSTVTCSHCQTVTEKYEANYMVSLQLPLTKLGMPIVPSRTTRPIRLEECFDEYFEPERIDEFACLNCTLIDRVVRATDAAVSRVPDRLPATEPRALLQSAEGLLHRCNAMKIAGLQGKVDALLQLPGDSTDKHALYQLQDTLLHTNNKLQRLEQTISRMKAGDPSVLQPATGIVSACIQLVRSLEDLQIELEMIVEIINYITSTVQSGSKDPKLLVRPAFRKQSFHHQPSVLILHIKRFHIGLTTSTKLQHILHFPVELDLNSVMSGGYFEALSVGKELSSTRYQLFGVVEHQGQLNSGHYIAYVEKPTGWYRCSDSHVSKATLEQVLRADAYILFYRRY